VNTEPLTSIEDDISGLDGFMLNTDRLMVSELWALSTGDEFKAALGLWCRAWKQTPAGSLPNDERVLAAFSGAGRDWHKVRDMALRGFVACDDGRLYHKTLCEDVKRAAESKRKRKDRTKAASEARNGQRNGQRNDNRNGGRDDEHKPPVTESHRQDRTGQEVKKGLPSLLSGADGFEEFWNAYPKRSGNADKAGAQDAFTSSPEDRAGLIDAAKAYAVWCGENGKTGTQYVKQAKAFIEDGLWKEWQPSGHAPMPQGVLVKRGTADWDAWQRIKKTAYSERYDGWWFPAKNPLISKDPVAIYESLMAENQSTPLIQRSAL
jgi:uncharacterized protein YdaU (DUF1376 family)